MTSITIDDDDDGQRIDRYIRKLLPSLWLGEVYKHLRTGYIKSSIWKLKSDSRVESWDVLIVPDILIQESKNIEKDKPSTLELQRIIDIKACILYEDDDILVINKPPSINVHPGDHKTQEVSIIELVQDYIQKEKWSALFDVALVHRLDRDTSGVLLIAKNRLSLNILLTELQSHQIAKKYIAFCVGVPKKRQDTIKLPLLRREVTKWPKVIVSPDGQSAVTHYIVKSQNGRVSALEVLLETGRMHQIRVHLAEIGCPVLGDKSYGLSLTRAFRVAHWHDLPTRQLLHAVTLAFHHPKTGELLKISAPLPEDMQAFAVKFGLSISQDS